MTGTDVAHGCVSLVCVFLTFGNKPGNNCIVHRVLVGKPEGKRPLGRPRRRWEDNIKDGSSGSGRGLRGLDGVGSG